MAAIWDAWSVGVIQSFTNAAKKVLDVWKNTVSSISNFLLTGALQGGVMGKIFSTIVAADLKELQAERDRLESDSNQKSIAVDRSNIDTTKQRIMAAQAAGDVAEVDGFAKCWPTLRPI